MEIVTLGSGPMLTYTDDRAVYHVDTCAALSAAAAAGDLELRALARDSYPGTRLRTREMPELRTVGYWDAARRQNWGLDWHRNEGIEFALLSRGRVDFAVDGGVHRLTPGSFTITRPWQLHRLGVPHVQASRLSWLILDVGVRRPNQAWQWPGWLVLGRAELERLTQLLQHNETPVWTADRAVIRAFETLAATVSRGRHPELISRMKLTINELLLSTLGLLERQPIALDPELSSSRRAVSVFLAALPEHIDRRWSVASMAAACGLGATRFAHYCAELTNCSPMAYLNALRIERAKMLIDSRADLPMTEIASLCGFDTSQYFSYRFRSETGLSPRRYRAAVQHEPSRRNVMRMPPPAR